MWLHWGRAIYLLFSIIRLRRSIHHRNKPFFVQAYFKLLREKKRENTSQFLPYCATLKVGREKRHSVAYQPFFVAANFTFEGRGGIAMPITFDRTICCNLDETISREWLLTNGLGGYAAGTVAGTLTRMQQGLLVAALDEESVPQVLLAKLDEEVHFDQRTYYLGTNEYQDGTLNPAGFVHLEAFRMEEGFPIFTYRLGGANGIMLEKRIWMPQEQNTTCIQYRVLRTSAPQQKSRNVGNNNWHNRSRSG